MAYTMHGSTLRQAAEPPPNAVPYSREQRILRYIDMGRPRSVQQDPRTTANPRDSRELRPIPQREAVCSKERHEQEYFDIISHFSILCNRGESQPKLVVMQSYDVSLL